MARFPVGVSTDGPRKIGGPLGSGSPVKSREHSSDKFRKAPVPNIQTGEVGLPEHHPRHTVLKENEGAGVVEMHGYASGRSRISILVQPPLFFGVDPGERLVPGEVRLDPSDSGQFGTVPKDNTPQVGMLALGCDTCIKKQTETVGHIPAVCENVDSPGYLRQDLGDRHDLGALGGLPRPTNRSGET